MGLDAADLAGSAADSDECDGDCRYNECFVSVKDFL
jgi:hypothetical protein